MDFSADYVGDYVVVGYGAYRAARIPCGKGERRDRAADDTSCRYDCAVADCHSRQYDGVGAYPDIASDSDRPGRHDAGIPLRGVQVMGYCVDAYVWPDEYIVADGDESLVEDCQIEVADEIMAYGYVEPEVASER